MAGSGTLVVFEGIEGSGKSTQARLFHEAIKKVTDLCTLTKEPSDSSITQYIREELKEGPPGEVERLDIRTLQLLFIADRSIHVEKTIKPALEAGRIVVTDRYYQSTVAYGSAFGKDYGLTADYLMGANSPFPKPDIVFYIRVSAEVALKRVADRHGQAERFDNLDSLERLDASYRSLARSYYSGERSVWCEIDGNRDQQSVAADVLAAWNERSAALAGPG